MVDAVASRPSPPAPLRSVLVRARLVGQLLDRFERRVVRIQAGAGFGKTTVLAQAVAENALAPRGIDVWVPCRPGDGSAGDLVRPILAGLGEPSPAGAVVDADGLVIDALWRLAPDPVAVIVDDVQLLPPGSEAAALLGRLVQHAPDHVHVVMAGRTIPSLPLARLLARGEVVDIGEADLIFDDRELKELALLRGAPAPSAATGGWPALVELSLSSGVQATADFLWEEVLAGLSDDQLELLRVVVAAGGADDALASELMGRPIDLRSALAGIPMVAVDTQGWCTVHGLWESVVAGRGAGPAGTPGSTSPSPAQEPTEQWPPPAVRRVAAQRAAADGYPGRAFELLAGAELWDDVLELLTAVCDSVNPPVDPDQLERWVDALPAAVAAAPPAILARGLARLDHDVDAAVALLQQARQHYEDAGDVTGELRVMTHLANNLYSRGDVATGAPLLARVEALAAGGHAVAGAYATFGRAAFWEMLGDAVQAHETLADVPEGSFGGSFAALATRLRAQGELLFGDLDRARLLALDAVDYGIAAFRPTAMTIVFYALWMQGRRAEALALLPDIQPPAHGSTRKHDIGSATNTALIAAWQGDTATAAAVLDPVLDDLQASEIVVSQVVGQLARAARLLAEGDEPAAAALLDDELTARPPAGRPTTAHLRALALPWILAPSTRPYFASLPLGAGPRLARRLADVLARSRESGAAALDEAVDVGTGRTEPFAWPAPAVVVSHLPVPWAVELAVRGLAAGGRHTEPAQAVLDELAPSAARPVLRRLLRHPDKAVARTAKAALADAAAPPPFRLRLEVLGPVRLRRDGRLVDHPDWRRERVRALLAELVRRRRATRDELAATLWPDLEPEAAANNLRVTLSYLLKVLEPDRAESEPSWFVRADRTLVTFEGGEAITVDVEEFERHLADAAGHEEAGTPSLATPSYLAACAVYGGDLLADVVVDAATELRRDRLRADFVAAAVRAGELVTASGDARTALTLAERALAADEWCEAAYRVAAAAHLAVDDRGAARRTLELALAKCDELDVAVEHRTAMLARRLNLDV